MTCSVLLWGGCQTTSTITTGAGGGPVGSPEVLRVGVSPNMPPFVFEEGGKLQGLEVDFADLLANELGMKVRFVKLSWKDQIPALRDNKIDIIMSGMNYNSERAALIAFTNPYMRSGQMALVMQKDVSKYPTRGFIVNTSGRVGVEAGTTGAYLVESTFPKATMRTYSSAERGALAVINGNIELFIHDAPTVYWMAGLYQNRGLTAAPQPLTQDLMVWGINRNNPELLNAVNTVLAQWSASGASDVILRRWVSF